MSALAAPLRLILARARRRPGRWALPVLGIALAAAFACAIAAAATVAGDSSARAELAGLSALDRTVRVSWDTAATPGAAAQARSLLHALGLSAQTQAVLLNPVRLSGVVVRPAAVAPLERWLGLSALDGIGRCRSRDCPMLLASGGHVRSMLSGNGVRISVARAAPLRSAVPLGFAPLATGEEPLLLTGDVAGLEALPGLSGIYRTHSWVAQLPVHGLHSWQLGALEARLARLQARLSGGASQFRLTAPFSGLDAARARAAAAPRRLLLAGGGAIAALALFIVLAGGALRRDQLAELGRLRNAGARADQRALFVVVEAGWLCALALAAGAGLGIAAAAVLASAAGEPVGTVLTHSILRPVGAIGLLTGWLAAVAIMTLSVLLRGPRVADALALAAASALAIGLTLNTGAQDPLAMLLAPLAGAVAGVVTFRLAAVLLQAGERLARQGPVMGRVALVGLARASGLPALAIAFVAVSVGLGGFALAYRATLLRGAADQAADRVPLDALVSAGADFRTPLQRAPLSRWRELAGGAVLPVRRAEANYASGSGTLTIPALGVPANGLPQMRGWRLSDGSAPLPVLAQRLHAAGPVRRPGPLLSIAARWLELRAAAAVVQVSVTADLRRPDGTVRQLSLGTAGATPSVLRARLPAGRWELEALELDEPAGVEITNAHQNAENPAPPAQFPARVSLGPLLALSVTHTPLTRVALGGWKALGAASAARPTGRTSVALRFATTGTPGLVRPLQPTDFHPVPVLVDPQTAAAAGPDGRLALTVDGLAVAARAVGTLRRFPTLAADAPGFLIADEATLSAALDAQRPGQGSPDELWISTPRPSELRRTLRTAKLAPLSATFRADVARALRDDPVARGVLGTLIAATALLALLAVLGLLSALLGGGRDQRVERDLEAQGIGPRALRGELRIRFALAAMLGVVVGLAVAVALTRLAVATVRAVGTAADPRPPLVTVVPWAQLVLWGVAVVAVLVLAGWLATRSLIGGRRAAALVPAHVPDGTRTLSEGLQR